MPHPTPSSTPREFLFDSAEHLLAQLTQRLGVALAEAIERRGEASLVVSGGRTPIDLFAALSHLDLEWSKVAVTLADERWVPPHDPDSNEGLVRRHLLQNRASEARLVGLYSPSPTPLAGVEEASRRLSTLRHPFDVVILGMGTDGHTASLFPDAEELPTALDLDHPAPCLAVHPESAPQPRMSLTLKSLLDSRWRILHLAGEAKWTVYRRACESGPVHELPIRAVLRHGIDVFWSR